LAPAFGVDNDGGSSRVRVGHRSRQRHKPQGGGGTTRVHYGDGILGRRVELVWSGSCYDNHLGVNGSQRGIHQRFGALRLGGLRGRLADGQRGKWYDCQRLLGRSTGDSGKTEVGDDLGLHRKN